MADLATPSAAAISTIDAGAEPSPKPQKTKPEKPDELKYKESLAKAQKEHAAAQERVDAIKAKIDLAQPQNKDSPSGKRQQELKSELQSVRQQQAAFKTSRGGTQDKIAGLDARLKSQIAEQKTKRSQVSWRTTGDIDQEIQRQEKIAESSNATLVDQKKAIAEISSLRKQKKAFVGFDEAQRAIDKLKADVAELRKQLDNPEGKALSQRFDAADRELKTLKAEQDEAYKGLNSLRTDRSKAYADQQEKWAAMKDIKDQYFKANKAYRDWDQEQYRLRLERQKAEKEAYQKERRRKIAEKKLEEASEPAYLDEILTSEGLIRYFDPSSPEAAKSLRGPSGFAAEVQRSVDTDSSGFKGTRISKKEDREDTYFMGTGGKKGKKGKKGGSSGVVGGGGGGSPAPGTPSTTTTTNEGMFNLSIGIIEELAKINVEPPMSQAGVPGVIEKLKSKRDQWKKDQERKTKENIEKAQKEIDRLETEAQESNNNSHQSPPHHHSSSSPPSHRHHHARKPAPAAAAPAPAVNGTAKVSDPEPKQEKKEDTVAADTNGVAEHVEKVALGDKDE